MMKPAISEQRRKRLLDRERKPRAERVPFRKSCWLAALYRAVFFLLASSILVATAFLFRGPEKAFRSEVLPSVLAAVVFAVAACLFLFHGAMRGLYPTREHRNTHICLIHTVIILSLAIGLGEIALSVALQKLGGDIIPRSALLALPLVLPYFFTPAVLTLLIGPVAGSIGGVGGNFLLTLLLLAGLPPETTHVDLTRAVVACSSAGILSAAFVPSLLSRPGSIRRRSRIVLAATKALLPVAIGTVSGYLVPLVLCRFRIVGWVIDKGPDKIALTVTAILAAVLCSLFAQAVLVALVLPALEHFFAQPSDITLQNYADLGNPLLERLSLEAPGTYNHSIMVATLAAAAAEKTGANPLLARVGAYYHDIGKLSKPLFFTENIQSEKNPHDTLSPGTSASLIRSHVKDGVILAERYHLPIPILKIIEEHHGTTVMAFFLAKARAAAADAAKADGGRAPSEVDEGLFRYPGPRPTSKESGILMLADAVEAATRSLAHATPSAIASKVDEIVNAKLLDGQFDDCPLTLGDLAEIRKVFTASLLSILHKRVAYPSPDELRDKPAETAAPAPEPPAPTQAPERP